MRNKISLQYNAEQQFQLDAISSIVDLFQGIPYQNQIDLPASTTNDVTPNFAQEELLDEILLFENLQAIQKKK